MSPHRNATRTGVRRYPRRPRKPTESQIMVDFASMWQPWGGAPDDDILVRFGLPEHAFYKRLANILIRGRARLTRVRRPCTC